MSLTLSGTVTSVPPTMGLPPALGAIPSEPRRDDGSLQPAAAATSAAAALDRARAASAVHFFAQGRDSASLTSDEDESGRSRAPKAVYDEIQRLQRVALSAPVIPLSAPVIPPGDAGAARSRGALRVLYPKVWRWSSRHADTVVCARLEVFLS